MDRLGYYEVAEGPLAAIAREKQIKGWLRARKVTLIEAANPDWADLVNTLRPPTTQILRSGDSAQNDWLQRRA